MDEPLAGTLFTVWWTVLGLMVGSFLNVAIARRPEDGESVAHPVRSRCPHCKRTLAWFENLPVLSWLALRAKCRTCGGPISWRYPAVELLTGLLFLWVAREHEGDLFRTVLDSTVLAMLVVATFVDFDRYEIPDGVSLGLCWAAPVIALVHPELHTGGRVADLLSGTDGPGRFEALGACLSGMALGGGILYSIGLLGKRLYGVDAMGFGDVKLMAGGGGLIGAGGVLHALLLAALLGSIVGVLNVARFQCELRRRVRQRSRKDPWLQSLQRARLAGRYIPFGPWLAVGIGLTLVRWEVDGPWLMRLLEP